MGHPEDGGAYRQILIEKKGHLLSKQFSKRGIKKDRAALKVRVADADGGNRPQVVQRAEQQSLYAASGDVSEKDSTVNLAGESVKSIASPEEKELPYAISPTKSASKEKQ